jgi:hypothetical protein
MVGPIGERWVPFKFTQIDVIEQPSRERRVASRDDVSSDYGGVVLIAGLLVSCAINSLLMS